MSLTNTAIKAAKARAKPYKLHDEKGLFLSVQPSGSRHWRFKYRYDGKEKKLAFGAFPEVGLKEARDKRDGARSLLADGKDPGQQRKDDKPVRAVQAANTFQAVADEYIDKKQREGLAPITLAKVAVVSLLNHRKYLYALPAILAMLAIPPALAAPM